MADAGAKEFHVRDIVAVYELSDISKPEVICQRHVRPTWLLGIDRFVTSIAQVNLTFGAHGLVADVPCLRLTRLESPWDKQAFCTFFQPNWT